MTKKLLSLAFAVAATLGAWADGLTTVNSQTLWTFGDYAGQTERVYSYNGIYLHSSQSGSVFDDFGTDATHLRSTSGTFTGTDIEWSTTKVLTVKNGCDLSALGDVDAISTSGADGALAFNYSGSGKLYVIYGATSKTDGEFHIMQRAKGKSSFTSLYHQAMSGVGYSGELGAPRRADGDYTFSQIEAVVNLLGTGTVYLGGTQPYCIYAILYVPKGVKYDLSTMVEDGNSKLEFSTEAQSLFVNELSNGIWTDRKRSDFYAITNLDSRLSVRQGASSVQISNGAIRLTRPFAIHQLSAGDEVSIHYSGGGTLTNATPSVGNSIRNNGSTVNAGDEITSGDVMTVTTIKANNNYIVLAPSGKVLISAIYINREEGVDDETATHFYISPEGNDENLGTLKSSPFRTLKKAQERARSGSTIHILPGTYQVTNNEYMDKSSDKTWNIVFNLNKDQIQYIGEQDENGKRPVFDFSGVTVEDNKRITAFHLTAKGIIIKNIETIGIKAAPVSGTQSENFRLNGATDCQLINIAAHHGEGIGFYIHRTSAGNIIQNCDAYENYDKTNSSGGNNDGFGCHVNAGYEGNQFIGCRAWHNADDGFDLKSCYSKVVIENSIAYKNGYATIDGVLTKVADGNGFKAGGFGKEAVTLPESGSPMHEVNNSIAAENKAGGFYSNHHLGGLQFTNNRAYHNSTDYRMTNRTMESVNQTIANADDPEMMADGYGHILMNNLSYKGATTISNIDVEKCTVAGNSFTYADGTWTNTSYTDDDFVSVDLGLLIKNRRTDGNYAGDVFNFMMLKDAGEAPAKPSWTETGREMGKVTYSISYPSDATLHYILPNAEEQTTTEGTEDEQGIKSVTLEVTADGEVKLYSQRGSKVSDVVTISVTVPKPTPAVTYNFVQLYKKNKDIDLSMNDATKTTRYFSQLNNEGSVEDKSGNFYDIEVSPINGMISWREKSVEIKASGLKPTNDARPFAIHHLVEGDVIRIEFSGDIYYAKHSTKGDALKDIAPGDAITSMMAYTVSAVDEENGYVMFYPTKATTISQISINEELTSSKASKPTISEPTENNDGSKSYTVTIHKGETLYYTAPDKDGEQSVIYDETDNGSYVITVTESGKLVCWTTLTGDTEKSEEVMVTVALAADEPTEKITIHTIGDSTMSSYDQSIPAQQGMDGWGDYLQDCLKSEWATVYNWADRGEGAKSYFNGIWSKTSSDRPEFGEPIMNKVKAGDFVIIQFGHNDSKAYSTEVYEEWMGKLVDAVKEKGATPIIASSICRRRFNADGTINLLGQINSIEDTKNRVPVNAVTGDEHEYDYPYHARKVAEAKGIEFIDVTAGTKALYESYGEKKSAAFFPSGEKTHTNKLGAQTIAKVAAQLLYGGKTALMKYVNTEALTLPDKESLEVIVESFGTDDVVTKKTIWTFNNYDEGATIANGVVSLNGLYARGAEDALITAAASSPVTTVTFSDDSQTSVSVSKSALVSSNTSGAGSIGQNTAGRTSANALKNTFALNVGTPGTFYAVMAPTEMGSGNMRLLFSGVEKVSIPVATAYANDNHLCELTFHAETTGVIYLCAGVASHLYAAMFVPDMEKGTEEDWNYQMVTTRSNGFWTYSNLSGGNQSVPEGLTVYAVKEINAEGKATLEDIGSVIPADGGFVVKGEPNTEYALPSTSDAASYEGTNLMVANSELRFLPVKEGSNTNYMFDGSKFVKASGSETIHTKQAYLSIETVADEVLLDIPEPAEPECVNATVTLADDSRKDRKVYQVVFGEKQKFYYMRPGQDTEARSQSYKAEFAENPFTVTVSYNGQFVYWTTETIDGNLYESEHNTIVVNTIAKKPTVTYQYVKDTLSVYRIIFSKGTTLHYTIGNGNEQTYAEKDTLDVSVKATGMMKVYSKNDYVVSDTTSVRAYAPTPSVLHDGIYDFTLLRDVIGADYTLTTWGYDSTLVVGGVTLNKPSAVTAKTFEGLALAAPVKNDVVSTESNDWRLLNAGRLRAYKSGNDKFLAIQHVPQGAYLVLNYSGAPVKYLPTGTARLPEGTDTLTNQKAYSVVTGGDLLLSIPADTLNCDITSIAFVQTETVGAPTIALKNDTVPNVVRIRAGKSSLGLTVSIRYTTDGTDPMLGNGIESVKSPLDLTFDEDVVVKAVTVSESGQFSDVTTFNLTLPVVEPSASVAYLLSDMIKNGIIECDSIGTSVYNKEYASADNLWTTKLRTDFMPLSATDGKLSVRAGSGSLQLQSDGTTIRLTRALAFHHLGVGDEIAIVYSGDGHLWSAGADEGDAFTIDGEPAVAGMLIPSGAILKVTKTKYANNYVVVTPSGPVSGKVNVKAIYINHEVPLEAHAPDVALHEVKDTTAVYRFAFDPHETLHYIMEIDGKEETQQSAEGIFDLPITRSTKIQTWTTREELVSDTLTMMLYAPTPAPTTDGFVDFNEVSNELPVDLEVTVDTNQPVSVEGETLYKPSMLTAATFNDRFAFSQPTTANKIRIRTNHQLAFAKGKDLQMALLNLKAGDIVAIDYTGTILINNSQIVRHAASAELPQLESGVSYEIQQDGDLLLTLSLAEASVNISRMYIGGPATASTPAAINFATAAEDYEDLTVGATTYVYYHGKSDAQKFQRLTNESFFLPIAGKLSAANTFTMVSGGFQTNGRIAIHNLAQRDSIRIRFNEGIVTYAGHATKGCVVSVGGRQLTSGDTLMTGDVIIVDKVDYLNNYVVLRLDGKGTVSGIFINSDESETVSTPTITDKGSNTVLITAGRSSTGCHVTTCYTTDGSEPTMYNGTCADGEYESFSVKLLDSGMVTVKAVTISDTGASSTVSVLTVYADKLVYGPSFLMDEDGNMYDVYNVWGQKVNDLRRGQLYIVNGKKVIFK